MCLGIEQGDTLTPLAIPGSCPSPSQNNLLHYIIAHDKVIFFTVLILIIMTIVIVYSGAMWALGLVVLLVTVAGVLALLVYVLKW